MGVYNIGFQLTDADGNRNTTAIKVSDAGKTLAAIEGYAQSIAQKIDNVCEAQVTGISVSWSVDVPGTVKPTPVVGSNNQEGALFQFGLNGSSYIEGIRIPGFLESNFSGKSVNLANGGVSALTTALVTGETHDAMTVQACNPFEVDLDSVITGVKSFRRK